MTCLTKIFELAQYNNYEELEKIIKYTNLDLKLPNRKSEYLIPTTIKYRSKECFELLIQSKFFDKTIPKLNGIFIAIEYYCNAPNDSNTYYLTMLLNKYVEFDLDVFLIIFRYRFPEIFNEYLINIINQDNFQKLFFFSILNLEAMKKLLDIGINKNIINEEIASNCLTCVNTHFYEALFEFVNNNINVFNIKENVLIYFHNNFSSPSTIKYLVDNVNKFNPDLNLSNLLITYCNNQNIQYNYVHNYNSYILCIYHILINFESLKKLKFKFRGIENNIIVILDEKKIASLIDYDSINYNKILIVIKTIELLFNEKYLNEDSNIFKNNNIKITNSNYNYNSTKFYNKLNIIKFFIKFFGTKKIKVPENLLYIDIPVDYQIDISEFLPKKIKPLK
jgi:hypothetical protein